MSSSIINVLSNAKLKLASSVVNPSLEADILLAHVLNVERAYLHTHPEKNLTEKETQLFQDYLTRRLNGEPIAYITRVKEFWSLDLSVTTETLIPRPETEILIETVLALFPDKNSELMVADLGTGSGAIAIALAYERPRWQIVATDVSDQTLQIASINAQTFARDRISFCLGNWCTALPPIAFDVIVSNPPYISEAEWSEVAKGLKYEPYRALVSGADGLDAVRVIVQEATRYLKSGGYLVIEHGYQQGEAVQQLFASSKYSKIQTVRDLAGKDRVTIGCFQKK